MHEHAEYGHAAHWLYKESESSPKISSNMSEMSELKAQDISIGSSNTANSKSRNGQRGSLKLGHPVLRVENGRLLAGVILR
jgi:hypothetical protein